MNPARILARYSLARGLRSGGVSYALARLLSLLTIPFSPKKNPRA